MIYLKYIYFIDKLWMATKTVRLASLDLLCTCAHKLCASELFDLVSVSFVINFVISIYLICKCDVSFQKPHTMHLNKAEDTNPLDCDSMSFSTWEHLGLFCVWSWSWSWSWSMPSPYTVTEQTNIHSVHLAVADSWCRFTMREKYCWLAGSWY